MRERGRHGELQPAAPGYREIVRVHELRHKLSGALGEHAPTVVLLAAVLALDQADKGAVGALAPSIEHDFHVTHFDIGLLAGAFSVLAAAATIPIGVATDRLRRVSLLLGSVLLWAVAMAIGGFAFSFVMLFVSRMFLGVVTATAGPTTVSLTGDLYPRRDRARILGFIQTGEMLGIGAGFLLVGAIVSWASWRWVFWILALLALGVAFALRRLPEPPRVAEGANPQGRDDVVVHAIKAQHVEPDAETVLDEDPTDMSLPSAMHEVVKVKTNVIVIVASAIGYFFFAGLRVFAVLFAVKQYGITNARASLLLPVVGIGAVAGLIVGGRTADRLLRRGVLSGRLIVAIVGFVLATVALVPALLVHSVLFALPLLTLGAAGLAAPNPPLDAVRLDVMHPALWGRAESVRTVARTAAEAVAPILFGFLADHIAGGGHEGLQLTMLIMLPALLANGLVLIFATRTYPHDVASVVESIANTRDLREASETR